MRPSALSAHRRAAVSGAVLEKLSGDAVEPNQLARLHDIHVGLSQPPQPAQGPAGAEVMSGGSWGTWYYGVLAST